MVNHFFDFATLIVGGVILADLLVNYKGTSILFSGINNLWQTSTNGMLGKTA